MLELGQPVPDLSAFDSIYSWYGTTRHEFRSSVSRLPFQFFPALPSGAGIHAVDFYMRQVGGADGAVPVVDVGPIEKLGFVAVHPFSGSSRKNWPIECFQEVARQSPLPVQFCAGPEEQLDGAVRFDNLWEVARWLGAADAYVGNDSGITHLAAAVGVPVLASFRTTDPAVWSPRGRARVRVIQRAPRIEDLLAILPR
jgi:hypothetical protein